MVMPFLKWAGGKRWLVADNLLPVPAGFERYIEPFLGGGAVFFHLMPRRAVLGDLNNELILAYRVLRDAPDALFNQLRKHHRKHCKEYYYYVRSIVPRTDLGRAARFLYLNRTCWNGLYRVNRKGEFNVPIGTKQTVIFDNDNFRQLAKVLKRASLRCADFQDLVETAGRDDFLFVDPPYTANHNMNGFLKYNEKIFSWQDQLRLFDCVDRAARRGAKVVVMNADHRSIRQLYKRNWDFARLDRNTVIGADAAARRQISEAMFTANL